MRIERIPVWPEFVTEGADLPSASRRTRHHCELLTGWETVVFRVEDDDQTVLEETRAGSQE